MDEADATLISITISSLSRINETLPHKDADIDTVC
jgi:hypothetical protein